jgi:hypothetical protein
MCCYERRELEIQPNDLQKPPRCATAATASAILRRVSGGGWRLSVMSFQRDASRGFSRSACSQRRRKPQCHKVPSSPSSPRHSDPRSCPHESPGLRRSPPRQPDSYGAAILFLAANERKPEVTVIIRLLAHANRTFLGARFDNSTGNATVTWDEKARLVARSTRRLW